MMCFLSTAAAIILMLNIYGCGDGGKECHGLPGPDMVVVDSPDGENYCIDATEVTQAQYEEFLTDRGSDPSGQPSHCAWNNTFGPEDSMGTCTPDSYSPDTHPTHPVVCVDWCDAHAYCLWAGKRLCGKIGGGPVPHYIRDATDASTSQWYNACSAGGVNKFPYGQEYEPETCNGDDSSHQGIVQVGSATGCRGTAEPFSGIYDMSGNAEEWEDCCEGQTGPNDFCAIRGGGFATWNVNGELECGDILYSISRNVSGYYSVGFRCCQ